MTSVSTSPSKHSVCFAQSHVYLLGFCYQNKHLFSLRSSLPVVLPYSILLINQCRCLDACIACFCCVCVCVFVSACVYFVHVDIFNTKTTVLHQGVCSKLCGYCRIFKCNGLVHRVMIPVYFPVALCVSAECMR